MLKKIAILLIVIGAVVWAGNSKGIKINGYKQALVPMKTFQTAPDIGSSIPRTPVISGMLSTSPGDTVGTTTYEWQQNGTMGNRIMVDKDGYVHHDWMYTGQSSPYNDRAIWYNFWKGSFQFGKGINASGSWRSGYTTLGIMPDGRAVCAFHRHPSGSGGGDKVRSAVTVDLGQGMGLFGAPVDVDTVTIVPQRNQAPFWPHMAVGPTGVIHVMAHAMNDTSPTEVLGWNTHQFYSRSTDEGATFTPWHEMTDVGSSDAAIATSKTSKKVGVALWNSNADPFANIILFESTDDGATWGGAQPITSYTPSPDTDYFYLGPMGYDMNLIYDHTDAPHFVFTEQLWRKSSTAGSGYLYYTALNRILHWSSKTGYSLVSGRGLITEDTTSSRMDTINLWGMSTGGTMEWDLCGANRPQLVVGTGDTLFCVFAGTKDTSDYSSSGFMNNDLYACFSPDNGKTWKGHGHLNDVVDLTNSHSPMADPGFCDNDGYLSVAPYVANNMLHIQYLDDKDAGNSLANPPNGMTTENPVLYLRYTLGPTCSLYGVEENGGPKPVTFALFSNRPNPFSHTTTISYQAGASDRVVLTIYDVAGRAVKTLVDAGPAAGPRQVQWNGRDTEGKPAPEGVYFYTVKAGTEQATGKMLLVR
jgi:hypothetical protein